MDAHDRDTAPAPERMAGPARGSFSCPSRPPPAGWAVQSPCMPGTSSASRTSRTSSQVRLGIDAFITLRLDGCMVLVGGDGLFLDEFPAVPVPALLA